MTNAKMLKIIGKNINAEGESIIQIKRQPYFDNENCFVLDILVEGENVSYSGDIDSFELVAKGEEALFRYHLESWEEKEEDVIMLKDDEKVEEKLNEYTELNPTWHIANYEYIEEENKLKIKAVYKPDVKRFVKKLARA